MIYTKEEISHKVFLSTVKSEKFKSAVISFTFTFPLSASAEAYTLPLPMLMRKGTEALQSIAMLNKALDELYGTYVEIRSPHIGKNISFAVTCELLDNKYIPDGTDVLGGTVNIVSGILLHPRFMCEDFDENEFRREIRVVDDMLKSEKNNTRAYAARKCSELLTGRPTVSELRELVLSASFEDIKKQYRHILFSCPLEIFYIGSAEFADVKEKVLSAFDGYEICDDSRNILYPATPINKKSFNSAAEKLPIRQSKLCMGFNTGVCISKNSREHYAMLMVNELFGGSPSSKLFMNVREAMSLCYYCSSSYNLYNGIILVSCGIEAEKLETVRSAVLAELDNIKNGSISEFEFSSAKASIINSYRQLYDSPMALQSFYGGRSLFGLNESIEDFMEGILSVTPTEVLEASRTLTLDAMFFVEGGSDKDEECEDE